MSEPIKVGDLVICVRSCCGAGVGHIFRVAVVEPAWLIHGCGLNSQGEVGAASHDAHGLHDSWYDLRWLKRIPPLFELDDVRQDEEITA